MESQPHESTPRTLAIDASLSSTRIASGRLETRTPVPRDDFVCLDLDLEPAHVAAHLGHWDRPALLESGPGFGAAGRWSILAAEPRTVCEASGRACRIEQADGGMLLVESDPLDLLRKLINDTLPRRSFTASLRFDTESPPFLGGWIGFLGYDLAPQIERVPRKAPRDSWIPDLRFSLYDTAVIHDRSNDTVRLYAFDLFGEGRDVILARARSWSDRLRQPQPRRRASRIVSPLESNFTHPYYLDAVRQAREYLAAGDIFQVNLSQRFAATGELHAYDLYERARAQSPCPYGAFLAWDDMAVVSASPECFFRIEGDRIITRPIKGTRPRGVDAADDARLIDELLSSPKDRAELTMIVDLERNDLGRFCRYGSVRVIDPMTIETYAQVHHMVATVEGELRADADHATILRSVFPGGSITGAPKIRAMEIIDELEPTRRSLYTGAIGYISSAGCEFNIAIRTMLIESNRVTYQVGGGIVIDSDPELEYEETLHKGRGLRAVLEASERPR